MCLPINFSAIEGGHRTWSIISFFAGRPFNTEGDFRDFGAEFQAQEVTTLGANCGLMGSFPTHLVFNDSGAKQNELLDHEDSDAAVQVSDLLKKADQTSNKPTQIGFLCLWLLRIKEMNLNKLSTANMYHAFLNCNRQDGIVGEDDFIKQFNSLVHAAMEMLKNHELYKTKFFSAPDIFGPNVTFRGAYEEMRTMMVRVKNF